MELEVLTKIADELMISNIIATVNNPNTFKEFLPEQQIKLLRIVKEHILKNAELIETNSHSKKRH